MYVYSLRYCGSCARSLFLLHSLWNKYIHSKYFFLSLYPPLLFPLWGITFVQAFIVIFVSFYSCDLSICFDFLCRSYFVLNFTAIQCKYFKVAIIIFIYYRRRPISLSTKHGIIWFSVRLWFDVFSWVPNNHPHPLMFLNISYLSITNNSWINLWINNKVFKLYPIEYR